MVDLGVPLAAAVEAAPMRKLRELKWLDLSPALWRRVCRCCTKEEHVKGDP